MRKRWIVVAVAVLLVGLLAAGFVYRVRFERVEGLYAPIYSADASEVLYVHRELFGVSFGLGYEFSSPPAHLWLFSDRFSLRRLTVASGDIETLKQWPNSPLAGRDNRHYRNRLYGLPSIRLHWAENGELEYTLAVRVNERPRAETWGIRRRWNNRINEMEGADVWATGYYRNWGYNEDAVRDTRELMSPRDGTYVPVAIYMRDHGAGTDRVLLETPRFPWAFPDGVPERWLEERAVRSKVAYLRKMRQAHKDALSRFKAEGLPEMAARLNTIKEMQRLGYYPKSPTITARRLSAEERRRIEAGPTPPLAVPEGEMRSGVFPDIEKAVAKPGEAVEKYSSKYVIHRDYENSAKLNGLLQAGQTRFHIVYRGQVYELAIERP